MFLRQVLRLPSLDELAPGPGKQSGGWKTARLADTEISHRRLCAEIRSPVRTRRRFPSSGDPSERQRRRACARDARVDHQKSVGRGEATKDDRHGCVRDAEREPLQRRTDEIVSQRVRCHGHGDERDENQESDPDKRMHREQVVPAVDKTPNACEPTHDRSVLRSSGASVALRDSRATASGSNRRRAERRTCVRFGRVQTFLI